MIIKNNKKNIKQPVPKKNRLNGKKNSTKIPIAKQKEKAIIIFLKKQFEMVGIDNISDKEILKIVKTPKWYLQHSWTFEKEKEFINWMINFIRKNKWVRDALDIPNFTKYIELYANMWIFEYGWTMRSNETQLSK